MSISAINAHLERIALETPKNGDLAQYLKRDTTGLLTRFERAVPTKEFYQEKEPATSFTLTSGYDAANSAFVNRKTGVAVGAKPHVFANTGNPRHVRGEGFVYAKHRNALFATLKDSHYGFTSLFEERENVWISWNPFRGHDREVYNHGVLVFTCHESQVETKLKAHFDFSDFEFEKPYESRRSVEPFVSGDIIARYAASGVVCGHLKIHMVAVAPVLSQARKITIEKLQDGRYLLYAGSVLAQGETIEIRHNNAVFGECVFLCRPFKGLQGFLKQFAAQVFDRDPATITVCNKEGESLVFTKNLIFQILSNGTMIENPYSNPKSLFASLYGADWIQPEVIGKPKIHAYDGVLKDVNVGYWLYMPITWEIDETRYAWSISHIYGEPQKENSLRAAFALGLIAPPQRYVNLVAMPIDWAEASEKQYVRKHWNGEDDSTARCKLSSSIEKIHCEKVAVYLLEKRDSYMRRISTTAGTAAEWRNKLLFRKSGFVTVVAPKNLATGVSVTQANGIYFAWETLRGFRHHVESRVSLKDAVNKLTSIRRVKGGILCLNDVRNDRTGTAGYCLVGVKAFAKHRMPFLYRQIEKYYTWDAIPSEIMETLHEPLPYVWEGYSNPTHA